MLVDDLRPRVVVAEFGRVRDGEAHPLQPALGDQVDDQLHLVQALVVGNFGLVPRLDKHLPAGLDERGDAPAQDGLLAEQVCLGLFLERRLDQTGFGAADGVAVGERQVPGSARRVLVDRHERRHALALDEQLAHTVARRFRRDHPHVDTLGRHDLLEVDVEAVRPDQRLAGRDFRANVVLEDAPLLFIGDEQHDHVGLTRGIGHFGYLQARLLGRIPGLRALVEADHDVEAGVVRVPGVRVALAAVTDDGNLLALEWADRRVGFGVDMCGHLSSPASDDRPSRSARRPDRGSWQPRPCGPAL